MDSNFIFCSVLGIFGAHHFYNGRSTAGVLTLLATLVSFGILGGIIAFIDWIYIVAGNYTDASGNKVTVKF